MSDCLLDGLEDVILRRLCLAAGPDFLSCPMGNGRTEQICLLWPSPGVWDNDVKDVDSGCENTGNSLRLNVLKKAARALRTFSIS